MSNPNYLLTQAIFAIQMANPEPTIRSSTGAVSSNSSQFFADSRHKEPRFSNKSYKNNRLNCVTQPRRHNHR